MGIEYRVMWKRAGLPVKHRRYLTRKGAERFMTLLGPEPWKAYGKDPDSPVCCEGYPTHHCNCKGVTYRQRDAELKADAPSLEFARVEYRTVGNWTA